MHQHMVEMRLQEVGRLAILVSLGVLLKDVAHGADDERRLGPCLGPFDERQQLEAHLPPAEGEGLELLETLTKWLVEQGRATGARELGEALFALSEYERSFIRQLSSFDAVLTPALAMTPRPLGWYDSHDAERNFAQQVQYTPYTSMVNVSGLPAITLPVWQTSDGLPMGVQLIGRPGGEAVLLSLGAQLQRRVRWQDRRPPVW